MIGIGLGVHRKRRATPPVVPDAPVVVSADAYYEEGYGYYIQMVVDSNLDTESIPDTSAFDLLINSISINITSITIEGYVFINLESPILYGDVITISYTKPALNPLKGINGGEVASFIDQAVTNNVEEVLPVAPTGLTAEVLSDTEIQLTWTDGDTNPISIETSTDGVNFTEDSTVENGVQTKTIGSLTAGTLYYARIRSYIGSVYSAYSDVVSALTLPSTKFLFWGKGSEIAAGEMPNLVGADALTVGGSEGSYTFQCPDTAPYIAADTDYIWFKTDETLRTPTEAELVGYDFPRTLVKYDNTTPYLIGEIIILDSTATLTEAEENALRDYMELSIWWSGVLSEHGVVKGNRVAERLIWPLVFDSFTDTDNVLLGDHTKEVGLAWELSPTNLFILDNKCQTTNSVEQNGTLVETGQADVEITMDITMPNATYYKAILYFRYDGVDINAVSLIRSAILNSGIPYLLLEDDTGTKHSLTQEDEITKSLKVVAVGASVSVYWGGVLIATVVTSLNLLATRHGFGNYRNADYANVMIDNFKIIKAQ